MHIIQVIPLLHKYLQTQTETHTYKMLYSWLELERDFILFFMCCAVSLFLYSISFSFTRSCLSRILDFVVSKKSKQMGKKNTKTLLKMENKLGWLWNENGFSCCIDKYWTIEVCVFFSSLLSNNSDKIWYFFRSLANHLALKFLFSSLFFFVRAFLFGWFWQMAKIRCCCYCCFLYSNGQQKNVVIVVCSKTDLYVCLLALDAVDAEAGVLGVRCLLAHILYPRNCLFDVYILLGVGSQMVYIFTLPHTRTHTLARN